MYIKSGYRKIRVFKNVNNILLGYYRHISRDLNYFRRLKNRGNTVLGNQKKNHIES